MKQYNVTITETLQKNVTVKAENAEKAEVTARNNYYAEADGYVLTANDYNGITEFSVSEAEETEIDKFSYKDKIAAASVAKKIFDYENLTLKCKKDGFIVQDIPNEYTYDYLCSTLMQAIDCIDGILGNSHLSGECENNWERMIYIILNSKLFTNILRTIDVGFYKKNINIINNANKDNDYHYEKYLINKSIAQKVMDTQSAYLMTEYEDKIYVSDYAIYDDCENGMQSFMADIIEYNDDKIIDPPFNIFDDYADVIKSEMQQIKDDYYDLGKADFYLTFEELTYIGTLED